MRKAIVYSLILGLSLASSGAEARDGSKTIRDNPGKGGFEAGGTDGMSKKATANYWDGLHARAMDKYDTLTQAEPDTQEYYDAADSYFSAKTGYETGTEADKYDGDLSKSYQVKELPDWGF